MSALAAGAAGRSAATRPSRRGTGASLLAQTVRELAPGRSLRANTLSAGWTVWLALLLSLLILVLLNLRGGVQNQSLVLPEACMIPVPFVIDYAGHCLQAGLCCF